MSLQTKGPATAIPCDPRERRVSDNLRSDVNDCHLHNLNVSDADAGVTALANGAEVGGDANVLQTHQKLNVIDLFCGCGGMSKGLTDAGLNVIAGIDIWNKAVDNYNKNFEHRAYCADLTTLPPETFDKLYNQTNQSIDLIVGGPPCQSFSAAGKRDKTDPRNTLFIEYVKYLDYFQPKAFIMENVIGLLSKKTASGEHVVDIIMKSFEENYNCVLCKLYASDFQVPQNRRRVIIIGVRKNLHIVPREPECIFKSVHDRLPVRDVLLRKEQVDRKYFLTERALVGLKKRNEISIQNGTSLRARMLDLDKPSYTILASYWKDGFNALLKYNEQEVRRLTIPELKKIQTFPDDYTIEGTHKDVIMQIGNAVPCKLAYYIGKHILHTLSCAMN